MYLARFSYDVLPVNRERAIEFIRQEIEAAHANGFRARLLVPLTRPHGGAALQFEVESVERAARRDRRVHIRVQLDHDRAEHHGDGPQDALPRHDAAAPPQPAGDYGARRGAVLAAGDFSASREMIRKYRRCFRGGGGDCGVGPAMNGLYRGEWRRTVLWACAAKNCPARQCSGRPPRLGRALRLPLRACE